MREPLNLFAGRQYNIVDIIMHLYIIPVDIGLFITFLFVLQYLHFEYNCYKKISYY